MNLKPLAFSIALLCSVPTMAAKPNTDLQLMPYPQQVSLTNSTPLVIDRHFNAQLTGFTSPRLTLLVERLNHRIEKQTGLFLTTPIQAKNQTPTLTIDVKAPAPTKVQRAKEDESYQLDVTSKQAKLTANTPYGAMRGIETFLQLIQSDTNGFNIPTVTIEDSPRFPWRGALIDTARHFIPVDVIKRQLDGLASAKLNTFHWHLTDDQGWRLESVAYPNLQEKGSDGHFYTREQIKDVVAYANSLGIRVIPEVDLPGHASAIAAAYPKLMTEVQDYQIERKWGVHKPLLDPTKPEVYQFINTLIREVTELFPDEYIHIGGDEVDPEQWNNSAHVQRFMKENNLKDALALHAYFNQRVEQILKRHKRKMIGWDETYHPDLPKSIVIQSWRGHDSLGESANDGYQGILSTGYYIDQAQPAAMHYRNDPMPKPLQINDVVAEGEQWQTWAFSAPRKKGSPVTGTFTLITAKDGIQRGFIDYKGKSRRAIFDIQSIKGVTQFWMDSWMGKTMPKVVLKDGVLTGDMQVGNANYPMTGKLIAASNIEGSQYPTAPKPVELKQKQQDRILGGEITLWAENVKYDTLELRMWPRSYVIAERLWSDASITDEDSMYQRMETMDDWSTLSVGLQHQWNSMVGLKRLANGHDIAPLQVLSEAIEQAQYYHRHHEKWVNENYDQFDPLNRLADTLPPESLEVRALKQKVNAFVKDPNNAALSTDIKAMFQRWADNTQAVMPIIASNHLLTQVEPVVQQVDLLSRTGIELVDIIQSGKKLDQKQIITIKQMIAKAKPIQDELVVAIVYPVETLLNYAY